MAFPSDRLWRVTGPNFVAGFTEYNDEITGAAPILRKWCGYGGNAVYAREVMERKGWKVEVVDETKDDS
jgi:hypothetical protein